MITIIHEIDRSKDIKKTCQGRSLDDYFMFS